MDEAFFLIVRPPSLKFLYTLCSRRRYAQDHKCTLSDVVLSALERELARREWHERLAQRPTTDLGASAASLLEQDRQQRERDLP